jgi:hypothetical protein
VHVIFAIKPNLARQKHIKMIVGSIHFIEYTVRMLSFYLAYSEKTNRNDSLNLLEKWVEGIQCLYCSLKPFIGFGPSF